MPEAWASVVDTAPQRNSRVSAVPTSPSIRDLAPLDLGGIEARDGFALQDHIAAGFCIDMAADSTLLEVWCESHDDITLIFIQIPL